MARFIRGAVILRKQHIMATQAKAEAVCCPKFDPAPWEDKVVEWSGKPFIKDRVLTSFYMPLNMGQVMKRLDEQAEAAGAHTPDKMCLSEHVSKWKMEVLLAVNKPVSGADNTELSGKFFSRVYEGPYGKVGKWTEDFRAVAKSRGLQVSKLYQWYTTCPKCAKKYGKNYVVVLGKVG